MTFIILQSKLQNYECRSLYIPSSRGLCATLSVRQARCPIPRRLACKGSDVLQSVSSSVCLANFLVVILFVTSACFSEHIRTVCGISVFGIPLSTRLFHVLTNGVTIVSTRSWEIISLESSDLCIQGLPLNKSIWTTSSMLSIRLLYLPVSNWQHGLWANTARVRLRCIRYSTCGEAFLQASISQMADGTTATNWII